MIIVIPFVAVAGVVAGCFLEWFVDRNNLAREQLATRSSADLAQDVIAYVDDVQLVVRVDGGAPLINMTLWQLTCVAHMGTDNVMPIAGGVSIEMRLRRRGG